MLHIIHLSVRVVFEFGICAETHSYQWKTQYSRHVDQMSIRVDVYLCEYVGLFSRVGSQDETHLQQ